MHIIVWNCMWNAEFDVLVFDCEWDWHRKKSFVILTQFYVLQIVLKNTFSVLCIFEAHCAVKLLNGGGGKTEIRAFLSAHTATKR